MTRQSFRADLLMLFIAMIWGSTFVAQRLGMDAVGPFFYSAARFLLGAMLLLPLVYYRGKEENGATASLWRDGTVLGLIIAVGINLQQVGLQYTSIANAGFITSLYVVIVPVIGIFLRHSMHRATWAGVFLAVAGMYFLSVKGNFEVAKGDWLQLTGTFAWAAHVILLSSLSRNHDPIRLSVVQFFVCGMACLLLSLIFEPIASQHVVQAVPAILYGGVLSVGLGYTLQVFAQRNAIPSHAAIIFSMESVFGALAAWLVLGETLSARAIFGCALMLSGMLIAQLVPLYLQKTPPSEPHPH
ncbi:DMT family transporter [Undibacterium piscinae]|uniref:DMT family transporter n=1 Tax=Undibacterium piscinae TaxID=2495591 RepID=A0A6M4A3V7_9BURK|nr:DMT family transporter [Undibacterium piscinae]